MSQDPRIEIAARAYWSHNRIQGMREWHEISEENREGYRRIAAEAVAAIDKDATITSVEELDALPIQSIVACMGIAPGTRNIPVTPVWQRGSVDNGGSDWCMPDTRGQITSTDVFYFLNVNQLRQELTVLHRGAE
ncbi:MAG TPA: hypothetical protein DCY59_11220 [Micrococcaceae bacterium]|nr:hypothetical protein [Micrococcaceae bacterium]